VPGSNPCPGQACDENQNACSSGCVSGCPSGQVCCNNVCRNCCTNSDCPTNQRCCASTYTCRLSCTKTPSEPEE
jgi:hypothetical protein